MYVCYKASRSGYINIGTGSSDIIKTNHAGLEADLNGWVPILPAWFPSRGCWRNSQMVLSQEGSLTRIPSASVSIGKFRRERRPACCA